MTAEQKVCAAKGHQPWTFATKTVTTDAWGTKTTRVRYCTGCEMDHPSRRIRTEA
jgi:hypothetical protein